MGLKLTHAITQHIPKQLTNSPKPGIKLFNDRKTNIGATMDASK